MKYGGGCDIPSLVSTFHPLYIPWPSKVPGKRVLLSKLPALLYLDFKPNHLIVPITLMFRFSRGLYARDSSTTFYITVKGRGTRQLWADGLPDAWGNLIIFMHLAVAIKKHSVFCWHHLILIEEWNQSLMLPQKMIMDAWFDMVIGNIFQVIILSLSHVNHLMIQREWRHDQSTSFESTLWKSLGKRAPCKGAS